jgi:serine/threonine-protein kinase
LQPGTVLADRYRIEAILGAGGFGVVWRAQHVHLDTDCAVKFFDPPPGADPQEAGARFLQEARVMARLKCPNVAQVFDYGVHEGMPFLVLELLRGNTLGVELRALREQGRRLGAQETALVVRHVAEALQLAHAARVVHRDLKPDNIFLVREDEKLLVKVLDFGIAKWSTEGAPGMTTSRIVMGTAHYMSPEQFESARSVDHRSDLWSLGVIAFECLTGQLPFPGETFIDVAFRVCRQGPLVASEIAEVPAGFEAWFARATALGREYRFASALEQAEALERVCSGLAELAPPAPERLPADAAQPTLPPAERALADAARPVPNLERRQPGSTDRGVEGPALRSPYRWGQRLVWLGAAGLVGLLLAWRVSFDGSAGPPRAQPAEATAAQLVEATAALQTQATAAPPTESTNVRTADSPSREVPPVSSSPRAPHHPKLAGLRTATAAAQTAARKTKPAPTASEPPPTAPAPPAETHVSNSELLAATSDTARASPANPATPAATPPARPDPDFSAFPLATNVKETFNHAAAKVALDAAFQRASHCESAREVSGGVVVSYEPSGHVTGVSLSTASWVPAETRSCVREEYERAQVPPFNGLREMVVQTFFQIPKKSE